MSETFERYQEHGPKHHSLGDLNVTKRNKRKQITKYLIAGTFILNWRADYWAGLFRGGQITVLLDRIQLLTVQDLIKFLIRTLAVGF
jgi:hypothetical protein